MFPVKTTIPFARFQSNKCNVFICNLLTSAFRAKTRQILKRRHWSLRGLEHTSLTEFPSDRLQIFIYWSFAPKVYTENSMSGVN